MWARHNSFLPWNNCDCLELVGVVATRWDCPEKLRIQLYVVDSWSFRHRARPSVISPMFVRVEFSQCSTVEYVSTFVFLTENKMWEIQFLFLPYFSNKVNGIPPSSWLYYDCDWLVRHRGGVEFVPIRHCAILRWLRACIYIVRLYTVRENRVYIYCPGFVVYDWAIDSSFITPLNSWGNERMISIRKTRSRADECSLS